MSQPTFIPAKRRVRRKRRQGQPRAMGPHFIGIVHSGGTHMVVTCSTDIGAVTDAASAMQVSVDGSVWIAPTAVAFAADQAMFTYGENVDGATRWRVADLSTWEFADGPLDVPYAGTIG